MKISSVDEMRAIDREAIERFGISAPLLMENAGGAAYAVLAREFGVAGKRFVVFCGLGNNGGDGCVVARRIHADGGDVQVVLLGDPAKYQGAAKANLEILARLPVDVCRIDGPEAARTAIDNCDFIIDAIFGTGLSRGVEGLHRDVIELINAAHKPVLSIDIPSGVNGDTGKVMGAAVRANLTVTFGLPKLGNLFYPGYELGGTLFVSHISFPPSLHQSDSLAVEINQPLAFPPRSASGHKGFFGKLLTIGGAANYLGAPYFSALSFLKSGGGYSRLATPESIASLIANKGSEIVLVPQRETTSGSISKVNKDALLQLIEDMDMVVLGPGLSLDEETQELARDLATEVTKPLLIDGDGITALRAHQEILRQRTGDTILTPHLGEMCRITGKSLSEVDEHKVNILQDTAEALNAFIVLKGAHSLVCYPDRHVFVNMSGNSGMATAGSGDVLTGAIAAMHCLGMQVRDAVRQGVFLHGLAGDLAARDKGEDGMTAQDILDHLPYAVKVCRDGPSDELAQSYAGALLV